jgi:hypothetical protein
MIWFACSQCGRKHSRPETSVGSLIFCECGQAITVPWESTIEAPEVPAEPVPPSVPVPPPLPRMEPIPLAEERLPVARSARRPRQERRAPRDPSRCFNHTDLPAETTCAGCQERFCTHCVVTFRGKTWCGPCKNKEIRTILRPSRPSTLAVFSSILAVLGYVGFCFFPLLPSSDLLVGAALVVFVQLLPLGLGIGALYRMQKDPFLTGRSLAFTGIVGAGLCMLLAGAASVLSAMPSI